MEAQGIEPWSKALPAKGVIALSIPFAPYGLQTLGCVVGSRCANVTVPHVVIDRTLKGQQTTQILVCFKGHELLVTVSAFFVQFSEQFAHQNGESLNLCELR